MSETLEGRVARLEAVEAIGNLKNTDHTYVNDAAFDQIADLFAEDAYVHLGYLMPGGRPWTGREQIRAAFSGMTSWLIKSMRLRLHFSVPLAAGWAGVKRHYLVNSGEQVPDYPGLAPNPPV